MTDDDEVRLWRNGDIQSAGELIPRTELPTHAQPVAQVTVGNPPRTLQGYVVP